MSAYTKGPWVVEDDFIATSAREDSRYIASTILMTKEFKKEESANAQLIAAAPELLEALKAIFEDNCFYHKDGDERAYRMAIEAIAKAEGAS